MCSILLSFILIPLHFTLLYSFLSHIVFCLLYEICRFSFVICAKNRRKSYLKILQKVSKFYFFLFFLYFSHPTSHFLIQQIDRKASKGRKIRYTRHPKLENFMFPVARTVSTSAFRSEGDPGSNSTVDSMSSSAFYRSLFQ